MAMIALRMTMVLAAMVMAVMVTRAAMVAMTMLSVMVRMLTDPKKLVDVFDPLTLGNQGPAEGRSGWVVGGLAPSGAAPPPSAGPSPTTLQQSQCLTRPAQKPREKGRLGTGNGKSFGAPQREGVDGWWEGWLRLGRRLPPLRGPHPLRYSKSKVLPGPPRRRARRGD